MTDLHPETKRKNMENKPKEYKATPEMAKFFENLLDLKEFVKRAAEEYEFNVMQEIYDKLDAIIKEEKND